MNLAHWIEEFSSASISWPVFAAVVVLVPAVLIVLGRASWKRYLDRWAVQEGFVLTSFRRANRAERARMRGRFGDCDSDWLEVFRVVGKTPAGEPLSGLAAFDSPLGLGPYRLREVRWSQ
jgi:hypothetical protein